ncbi:MAG: hypothetical protein GY769_20135 [bacterium]|nr:hypothetical protein [bacterium]
MACAHADKKRIGPTIYHWCRDCGALGMTLTSYYTEEDNKPLPKGTHRIVWKWEQPRKEPK